MAPTWRRGRWEKHQGDADDQDGKEISWASKSWSGNWSAGWKSSSSGSWKEENGWSSTWYKGESWSDSKGRSWSREREASEHSSEEDACENREPVRRVTLLARPAKDHGSPPRSRPQRSERQEDRRVQPIRRYLCARSPGREKATIIRRGPSEAEPEPPAESSPGSPMSVGSSVIPDGQEDEKSLDQDEDDGSRSDNYVALPVELLDDSEIPGPVRPEQDKEARRRKDAAEAAKFAAPHAKGSSSNTPAVGSSASVGSSAPRRKKQRTMATATPGTANDQPATSSGSTKSNAACEVDKWRDSSRGTVKRTEPVERTAAKVYKEPTWQDLNSQELADFQETLLTRLRTVCASEDDSAIIAEICMVMIGEEKAREELGEELAFMGKETEPFLSWVEDRKSELLKQKREAEAQLRAQQAPAPSSDAPPAITKIADSSRASRRRKRSEKKDKYVVRTSRLVLQPNVQNSARESDSDDAKRSGKVGEFSRSSSKADTSSDSSEEDAEEKKKTEEDVAEEKRIALLTEMTARLQAILAKLSDKNLDDLSREKYQAMAQRIQETMTKCSKASEGDGFDFQVGDQLAGSW